MRDIYNPTPEEILRIRPKEGHLKISGDGIFATRQGEGVTAGMNAIFIRLHFCNLACGRDGGWKCDTEYTWDNRFPKFWQEPIDLEIPTVASLIKDSWTGTDNERRLVVTGGEPLLQQRKIVKLLEYLPGWAVEIETNGTVLPLPDLSNCQFNCSPKLGNSGNSLNHRYRPDVIKQMALLPNTWFKFVALNQSDLLEIQTIVDECSIPIEKILIMPEGSTEESVSEHATALEEAVTKKGWRLTMRNQLVWFGPKRRT